MQENKTYDTKYGRMEITDEFIVKNKFSLLRSQEEIVNKILAHKEFICDFTTEVIYKYLTFENVKLFLSKEGTEKYKNEELIWVQITDLKEAVQDFCDYMFFAWMKILDQRGLSSSRNISKLSAWLWLFGRDDLVKILNDETLYNPYGSPAIIKVCNELGISVPEELIEFSKNKL